MGTHISDSFLVYYQQMLAQVMEERKREEKKTDVERFVDYLAKEDDPLEQAKNAMNDYIRLKLREDGFARKIMPPMPVKAEDLDG